MAKIRNEIYDETGLIDVQYIETDEQTPEEIIAQKEAEVLKAFDELNALKFIQTQITNEN